MSNEKRVRNIPDKERLRIVRDMSQLQTEIMLRFNTFICEDVTRYDLTDADIERFKESINFVMDEKFGFIERAIAEATKQSFIKTLNNQVDDLELLKALEQQHLCREDVYTFSIRLCDNEIDRDFERFTTQALEEFAPMFVGRSGIFDHRWSARDQTPRIYKTEVIREPDRLTKAGDSYCWLKGYAYVVRTDSIGDLIAKIEGGIIKDVSVSCSVKKVVCSICGHDLNECSHKKGAEYGGQICHGILTGTTDVYEWAFVASPHNNS